MTSSVMRPASNSAQHLGSSWIRRAIRTRPAARASDTHAFQVTQCSGERIPWPCHPSVASSMAIVDTSWAMAAFTVPMSATVRCSPSHQARSCG